MLYEILGVGEHVPHIGSTDDHAQGSITESTTDLVSVSYAKNPENTKDGFVSHPPGTILYWGATPQSYVSSLQCPKIQPSTLAAKDSEDACSSLSSIRDMPQETAPRQGASSPKAVQPTEQQPNLEPIQQMVTGASLTCLHVEPTTLSKSVTQAVRVNAPPISIPTKPSSGPEIATKTGQALIGPVSSLSHSPILSAGVKAVLVARSQISAGLQEAPSSLAHVANQPGFNVSLPQGYASEASHTPMESQKNRTPDSSVATSISMLSFTGEYVNEVMYYDGLSPFTKIFVLDLARSILAQGARHQKPSDSGAVSHIHGRAHSSTTQKSTSVSTSSGTIGPVSKRSVAIKRKRDGDPFGSDSEDEPEKGSPKAYGEPGSCAGKVYACPFAKFDSERYSERNPEEVLYRKCGTYMLRSIPRVMQHLYRVHRRPEHYCPICSATLESQTLLEEHLLAQTCLRLEPALYMERMSTDQIKVIKRRNKKESAYKQWFSIFRILFPQAALPQSPYAGKDETVQHFASFFRAVGPEALFELMRQREEQGLLQPFSAPVQVIVDEAFEIAAPVHMNNVQIAVGDTRNTPDRVQPQPTGNDSAIGYTGSDNTLPKLETNGIDGLGFGAFDDMLSGDFNDDQFDDVPFDPLTVDDAFAAYFVPEQH